jgi:hypothetical protein
VRVTLGLADRQRVLGDPVDGFCGDRLGGTVYGLLHRERDRLFPDEMFADLFTTRGRRSIPPSVVACVLVLKQLEGLSDVEAADRFVYDARWRHACGVGAWETSLVEFDRTVLVKFRMRLERSADPRRIFTVTTKVAAEAGLVGVRRVLDSAPLFDAVATMDTVTLVRSAIRGLLKTAEAKVESELRGVLSGDDDYRGAGKPACDWNDADARAGVIDRLGCDGVALLGVLEGCRLEPALDQAAELLATVIGQDLQRDNEGRFKIVRGVATDRVISTVDPEARHGRKSTSGKFDGYKGHVAIDPDSEIITDAAAGPANAGDGQMTGRLTGDLDRDDDGHDVDGHDDDGHDDDGHDDDGHDVDDGEDRPAVYGDAAYGSGEQLADLEARGIDARVKTQPPAGRGGKFSKGEFDIDLVADTVSCPAGTTVPIVRSSDGSGTASFGRRCTTCPLRGRCTDAAAGRKITVHRHEALLARQRARGADPDWVADYRATRPKVERKLAHLVRRGRRARRRGLQRVDADWNLLAGAVNLARLATQGVRHDGDRWATAPA